MTKLERRTIYEYVSKEMTLVLRTGLFTLCSLIACCHACLFVRVWTYYYHLIAILVLTPVWYTVTVFH